MKLPIALAAVASAASLLGVAAAESEDCIKLSVSVRHEVEAKSNLVLEVVEKQVSAHPGCACEVVKAAIEGSEADNKLVAAIVEVAASVAPEHMRLISQCALAVAPDALADVQSVIFRLEPNRGEAVVTDAKSPKTPIEVKPAWNPLDFPGEGPIGPNPGGPGGDPLIPEIPPVPHDDGLIPPEVDFPGTAINY